MKPFSMLLNTKLYEEDLEIHSLVKQNETRLERLFT